MPEITGYPQGTPSWAELSTTDAAGALEFYSALLGWEDDPQSMGPDMGFYHMQRLRGLEAAALYEQGPEEKAQGIPAHWRTYFTVTNTDDAVEPAKAAGGSVVFGPMDVFEAGRTCMLMDPPGRPCSRCGNPTSILGPASRTSPALSCGASCGPATPRPRPSSTPRCSRRNRARRIWIYPWSTPS